MTRSAKNIATTIILTLVLSIPSFAQEMYTSNSVKTAYAGNSTTAEENKVNKIAVAVNPAIAAKFSTLVPGATQLQWAAGDNNFWVSFLNNGRKANASLSLKGKMNYMITDCTIEQLPEPFIMSIKTQYASYHLFNAIQITAHNTVAYQAILENAEGFITLKYTEDGIEEMQQVRKAAY